MSAEEIVWEVSHRYTMLPEGTLKRIHVNQHHIRHNAKNPDDKKPPFTCKTSKANHKAWGVDINGPSHLVYSPDKPLSCGAKVWIETTAIVGMSEQIEQEICPSCDCILRQDEGDQCRWCEELNDE